MQLSPAQLNGFDPDGYLFSPGLLRPDEALPDDCRVKPCPEELPWKDGTPAPALVTSLDERVAA